MRLGAPFMQGFVQVNCYENRCNVVVLVLQHSTSKSILCSLKVGSFRKGELQSSLDVLLM